MADLWKTCLGAGYNQLGCQNRLSSADRRPEAKLPLRPRLSPKYPPKAPKLGRKVTLMESMAFLSVRYWFASDAENPPALLAGHASNPRCRRSFRRPPRALPRTVWNGFRSLAGNGFRGFGMDSAPAAGVFREPTVPKVRPASSTLGLPPTMTAPMCSATASCLLKP